MKHHQINQASGPYVIGVVLGDLKSGYEYQIYTGIRDAAKVLNVTVIFFPIKPIGVEVQTRANYPSVNDFIMGHLFDPKHLDSVIVLSEILQVFYTPEQVTAFYAMFSDIPLVNIGHSERPDTYVTIDCDHYDGMRQMMTHVIETCAYERIAFIRGIPKNSSADRRFRAYQDALAYYDRSFDDRYLVTGDFKSPSGMEAIKTLFDDRNLSPEVIVASNDDMALGALWELHKRNFKVPLDIGVTGFDASEESVLYHPALTSVLQPTYLMGFKAMEAVISQLKEEKAPKSVMLPARLLVRDSCRAHLNKQTFSMPEFTFDIACKKIWQDEILPLLTSIAPNLNEAQLMGLVDLFWQAVNGKTGADEFLSCFKAIMSKIPYWLSYFQRLQIAMDHLKTATQQQVLDPVLRIRALGICYEMRAIIDARITDQHSGWQRATSMVVEAENEMLYTPTLETLNRVLNQTLHRIGIQYCYISLFDSYPEPSTQPRLAIEINPQEGAILHKAHTVFPISQWYDSIIPPDTNTKRWLVSLLHYRDEFIGFLVISMEPREGLIYEALRIHIGSMLKLMLSTQRLQEYASELEHKVQARTQDLHTIIDEKQDLLGIVAHDLRTPLAGLQIGTSLLEGRWHGMQTDKVDRILGLIDQHSQNMLSIIERLLQNNKAEQENFTVKIQRVALCGLIRTVAEGLGRSASHKNIVLILNLPPEEVFVQADPDLLKQVLDNLISNAIKYSWPKTAVTINIQKRTTTHQVRVTDEGQGLSEADLKKLFGKYQRLSAHPTGGESSVGLGLYIVKKMVTAMNGTVSVTSPGKDQVIANSEDAVAARIILTDTET
ncbi:MAG: substrate-binding domain-containing protein [Chloroflexota bacterium]